MKFFKNILFEYIHAVTFRWSSLFFGFIISTLYGIIPFLNSHQTCLPIVNPGCKDNFFDQIPIEVLIIAAFIVANFLVYKDLKKKNTALTNDIANLLSKQPKFEITFSDYGEEGALFQPVFYKEKVATAEQEDKSTKKKVENFPFSAVYGLTHAFEGSASILAEVARQATQTQKDQMQYRLDYERWEKTLSSYIPIELNLENTGNAPAHSVYIEIELPSDILAYEDIPGEPENPDPMSRLVAYPRSATPLYSWVKVENNIVTLKIDKAQHNLPVTLNRFYILPPSDKKAEYTLSMSIKCNEIPKPIPYELKFVVNPRVEDYTLEK